VSPVRFHTPSASQPNNPDKGDGEEIDKHSDSDSENKTDKNENNPPAAGGGNANNSSKKNSGDPGGDPDDSDDEPHDGNDNQGSDSGSDADNNIEAMDEIFSPSIQNQLANHIEKLNDKIDTFRNE